jgi:hypothetical protein
MNPDTARGSEPLLENPGAAPTPMGATNPNPSATAEAASHLKRLAIPMIPVLMVLGLTFWLYAKPGVVIMLAEQLWSCF